MRESVIYQEIKAEGKVEGKAEGKAEGLVEGKAAFAVQLLQHKLGVLPSELETRVLELSLVQLEALGSVLLGFSTLEELRSWLDEHD